MPEMREHTPRQTGSQISFSKTTTSAPPKEQLDQQPDTETRQHSRRQTQATLFVSHQHPRTRRDLFRRPRQCRRQRRRSAACQRCSNGRRSQLTETETFRQQFEVTNQATVRGDSYVCFSHPRTRHLSRRTRHAASNSDEPPRANDVDRLLHAANSPRRPSLCESSHAGEDARPPYDTDYGSEGVLVPAFAEICLLGVAARSGGADQAGVASRLKLKQYHGNT